MIGAYVAQQFWKFIFPGDRASPSLIAAAVLINGAAMLSASAAWEDASNGHCLEGTKAWLAAGAVSDVIHVVFAIYFVVAVRRRASKCTVVAPDLTVAKFVLHDYGFWVYCIFCVWVVIWMGVTYHKYPLSSARRVRVINDNLPDSDDSVPYTCDVCCTFCTVLSSINVAYIPLVAFLIASTLVTEGFRQPRWWHTILLQDLRQRELRALYDEERPRSPTRANLNTDTDREMRAAGYNVPSRPPREHAHLRYRRPDKKYETVQSEDADERRHRPPAALPRTTATHVAVSNAKLWAPPAPVEQVPPAVASKHIRVPGEPPVQPVVGRNIAPGAKRRPLNTLTQREDRQVRFATDDAAFWRPPTAESTPKPVAPRTTTRIKSAGTHATASSAPSIQGARPQPRPPPPQQQAQHQEHCLLQRSDSAEGFVTTIPSAQEERMSQPRPPPPVDNVISTSRATAPSATSAAAISSAYVSSELENIRALLRAPAHSLDHHSLEFEIDSEEDFELDENALDFEIGDELSD
jgi:hypothetical protein